MQSRLAAAGLRDISDKLDTGLRLTLADGVRLFETPDLLSVVEAIEDSLTTAPAQAEEVDVLRRVFDSVLRGAEAVGFDTTPERLWLQSLNRGAKASA